MTDIKDVKNNKPCGRPVYTHMAESEFIRLIVKPYSDKVQYDSKTREVRITDTVFSGRFWNNHTKFILTDHKVVTVTKPIEITKSIMDSAVMSNIYFLCNQVILDLGDKYVHIGFVTSLASSPLVNQLYGNGQVINKFFPEVPVIFTPVIDERTGRAYGGDFQEYNGAAVPTIIKDGIFPQIPFSPYIGYDIADGVYKHKKEVVVIQEGQLMYSMDDNTTTQYINGLIVKETENRSMVSMTYSGGLANGIQETQLSKSYSKIGYKCGVMDGIVDVQYPRGNFSVRISGQVTNPDKYSYRDGHLEKLPKAEMTEATRWRPSVFRRLVWIGYGLRFEPPSDAFIKHIDGIKTGLWVESEIEGGKDGKEYVMSRLNYSSYSLDGTKYQGAQKWYAYTDNQVNDILQRQGKGDIELIGNVGVLTQYYFDGYEYSQEEYTQLLNTIAKAIPVKDLNSMMIKYL